MANLMISPQDKKQEAATTLLRDESKCRILDPSLYGLPGFWDRSVLFEVRTLCFHMKLVSRASRPGLTVGFLRILCNGPCTAQRFHAEGEEQMPGWMSGRTRLSPTLQRVSSVV